MNYPENNTYSIETSNLKRIKPRYIVIKEDIFKTLDPDSINIYMAIRYEFDYQVDTICIVRHNWGSKLVGYFNVPHTGN